MYLEETFYEIVDQMNTTILGFIKAANFSSNYLLASEQRQVSMDFVN